MSSFDPFIDEHGDFLEALLDHQAALVRGDLESARDGLVALAEALDRHARHEEERLLPVLERAGEWSRIGDPRFYRDEHAKIRTMFAALVEATNALDAAEPDVDREIALLIGRERALWTLLEHHHDREERALFPDLERLATPEERARMLEPPGEEARGA